MAFAMDAAIQQASQAVDTSGIGANSLQGLQLGMSLAQRQQQVEQQKQQMEFQRQQMEMKKGDWLHSQLSQISSEDDPKIRGALVDSMSDQYPKLFGGRRVDPTQMELLKKSPPYLDRVAAMTRVRKAMADGNFSNLSDFDKEVINGMSSSDISTQLGHLNTIQSQEMNITKALTAARVATPQAAAQAGTSQEELQQNLTQGNPWQARVTSQQSMQAQQTVNKDTLMNAYKQRLDGASRVNDLIKDAEPHVDPDTGKTIPGKIKTNAAFLGQLNAEISRLETGSQTPGLTASEKTEYTSAVADFTRIKDRITGKPSDAVSPEIIKQIRGTMNSMTDSYMQSVDDRYSSLASGLTPIQQPIVQAKWAQDAKNYSSRFGHWAPESKIGQQQAQPAAQPGVNPGLAAPAPNPAPNRPNESELGEIEATARERLRQARAAQKAGTPVSFTEQQVKDTYKKLTGKDLVE